MTAEAAFVSRQRSKGTNNKNNRFGNDPILAIASLILLTWSLLAIVQVELSSRQEKLTPKTLLDQIYQESLSLRSKLLHRIQHEEEPPISIENATTVLLDWIQSLQRALNSNAAASSSPEQMWKTYHDVTQSKLIPWDAEYLSRFPTPREEDSIFLSLASFRDEHCFDTLSWAYGNASFPERLFVGLVQQNCLENCKTGRQANGQYIDSGGPDDDCYQLFCEAFPQYCTQIRPLLLREQDSLGPYGARYLASKLYGGEQWYMQLDAHMTFLKNWDDISLKSLHAAPSAKPVISHYPPGHKMSLQNYWSVRPAGRLCGPMFSSTDGYMIRMEGLKKWDTIKIDIPRFGPFVGAGFLMGPASMLKDVPFDPYLPWIFMGEEIILSSRLWTSGYDLFSPAQAVVGHYYVRKNKPKFWETFGHTFQKVSHATLESIVLLRIKHQLGYPEAAGDMIPLSTKTLLDDLEPYYSMGKERSLQDYMHYAGIDVTRKLIFETKYCEEHLMPPGKEHLAQVYRDAEANAIKLNETANSL